MVKYVSTYLGHVGYTFNNRSAKDLFGDVYVIIFTLIVFIHVIKAYIMGTHLNCINVNPVQMGTHNIFLYKEVDKMYSSCNLKTRELLDCIGIYVVIKSNFKVC